MNSNEYSGFSSVHTMYFIYYYIVYEHHGCIIHNFKKWGTKKLTFAVVNYSSPQPVPAQTGQTSHDQQVPLGPRQCHVHPLLRVYEPKVPRPDTRQDDDFPLCALERVHRGHLDRLDFKSLRVNPTEQILDLWAKKQARGLVGIVQSLPTLCTSRFKQTALLTFIVVDLWYKPYTFVIYKG